MKSDGRKPIRVRWDNATNRVGRHPEIAIVGLGSTFGLAALLLALALVDHHIPADFFAVAAQVFPVFLVALAVEQRLVDRLGHSEEQYVRDAERALDTSVKALLAYEDGQEQEAYALLASARAQRHVRWAADLSHDALEGDPSDQPSVDAMARERYRRRRRGEVVLVAAAIGMLVIGEIAALVGLLADGAGANSAWFLVTLATLIATFVLITLAAFRELLPALGD